MFPTQSDDLTADFGGLTGGISSYMNWNGRIGEIARVWFGGYLAHMQIFNFINAGIGVGVIYMFFVLMFGRLPKAGLSDSIIIFCILLLLMIYSAFGSIFYWAAGSFNYLWAYFVIFLYLIPYRIFWHNTLQNQPISNKSIESIKALSMFFLGVIAGWGSELNIITLFVFLASILVAWRKNIKLPLWYFTGGFGFFAGWLILYFSPGTAKRAELVKSFGLYFSLRDLWSMSLEEKIARIEYIFFIFPRRNIMYLGVTLMLASAIYTSQKFTHLKALVVWILSSVFIVMCCIFIHKFFMLIFGVIYCALLWWDCKRSEFKTEAKLFQALIYAFMIYIVYILATIQVEVPHRAQLQYTLINIVITTAFLVYFQTKFVLLYKFIGSGIVLATLIYGFHVAYECFIMNNKWQQMLGFIEGQKALGNQDIVLDYKYFKSGYRNYGDWGNPGDDPNKWPNNEYARYFGLRTLKVTINTKCNPLTHAKNILKLI